MSTEQEQINGLTDSLNAMNAAYENKCQQIANSMVNIELALQQLSLSGRVQEETLRAAHHERAVHILKLTARKVL